MKSTITAYTLIVLGILFGLGDVNDPDRMFIATLLVIIGAIILFVKSIRGLIHTTNANKKAGK